MRKKVREIRPLDGAASPVGRDRRGDGPKGLLDRGVPVVDFADVAASAAEEELGLAMHKGPRLVQDLVRSPSAIAKGAAS